MQNCCFKRHFTTDHLSDLRTMQKTYANTNEIKYTTTFQLVSEQTVAVTATSRVSVLNVVPALYKLTAIVTHLLQTVLYRSKSQNRFNPSSSGFPIFTERVGTFSDWCDWAAQSH